jgi:hypothetical protein
VGINLNIDDVVFQLIIFIILSWIFSIVFFIIRSYFIDQPNKTNNIEQKLDKIIKLLEKDKGE